MSNLFKLVFRYLFIALFSFTLVSSVIAAPAPPVSPTAIPSCNTSLTYFSAKKRCETPSGMEFAEATFTCYGSSVIQTMSQGYCNDYTNLFQNAIATCQKACVSPSPKETQAPSPTATPPSSPAYSPRPSYSPTYSIAPSPKASVFETTIPRPSSYPSPSVNACAKQLGSWKFGDSCGPRGYRTMVYQCKGDADMQKMPDTSTCKSEKQWISEATILCQNFQCSTPTPVPSPIAVVKPPSIPSRYSCMSKCYFVWNRISRAQCFKSCGRYQ